MSITTDQMLAEVRRELGMRRHVYPRFVQQQKLTQEQADERIARLDAVRELIEAIREQEREREAQRTPSLFDSTPTCVGCGAITKAAACAKYPRCVGAQTFSGD